MHHSIAIGVFKLELQYRNAQLGSKSAFLSGVTLKFDGWPWKTVEHLLYAMLTFVHHFMAISEIKLSENTKFRSKLPLWPWNFTDNLAKQWGTTTSSSGHHFIAINETKLQLQSRNAQFGSKSIMFCPMWPWNLTDDLEKNRAPLLWYFKLCSSFRSHQWIQTGVTVRKCSIWIKIGDI